MTRIRRWFTASRKVGWSEPGLPPWVKINPESEPGLATDPQPGDMSMRAVVEEFLESEEDEEAVPETEEEPRPGDHPDQPPATEHE